MNRFGRLIKNVGIGGVLSAMLIPVHGGALPVAGGSAIMDSAAASGYRRYTTLSCGVIIGRFESMAAGEQRLAWREHWPDTIATANAPDSLARKASLRMIGREVLRCLSGQTPEQVASGHLMTAGRAWLTANDDAKASAAFDRAVRNVAKESAPKRALVLSQIIQAYIGASDSSRVSSALNYMSQLDALGPAVAGRRIAMRNTIYQIAQIRDDIALMETQAQAALRAYAELTTDGRLEWVQESAEAFINQANTLMRQGRYANAIEVLQKAKQDVGVLNPKRTQMIDFTLIKANLYGTPAKPVQATWVYWPGQSTPDSSLARPVRGRFSLYAFFAHNMGMGDIGNFKIVQRLAAKYGNRIDVTILEETTGFDALRQSLAKPSEEAKEIAAFYHGYLSMPVPVAIFDRPVTGKRADGAVERGANPNDLPLVKMVLIDPQGKICYVSDWFNRDFVEGRIKNIIENWRDS